MASAQYELIFKILTEGAEEAKKQIEGLSKSQRDALEASEAVGKEWEGYAKYVPAFAQTNEKIKEIADASEKAGHGAKFAADYMGALANLKWDSFTAALKGGAASANDATSKVKDFAEALKLAGHAADMPQLGALGRIMGQLGSASLQLAGPLAFAGVVKGLSGIATGAAEVHEKMNSLANVMGEDAGDVEHAASAFKLAGVSSDDMAKHIEKLPDLLEKYEKGQERASDETGKFQKTMDHLRDASAAGTSGFTKINQEQSKLNQQFQQGKINLDQYQQGMQNLNQQSLALSHQLDAIDQQQKDAEQQHRKNMNAIDGQNSAFGRLMETYKEAKASGQGVKEAQDEVFKAFMKLPDGIEKNRAAVKLWGADAGKMIEQAKEGEKAFDELNKKMAELDPKPTAEELKAAKELTKASNELKAAWDGVYNAIARAITPEVTQLINQLKDALVAIKPVLVEIAKQIVGFAKDISDFIKSWWDFWESVGKIIGKVVVAMKKEWDAFFRDLKNAWNEFVAFVEASTKAMLAGIKQLIEWAKQAYDWVKKALGLGGGDDSGLAPTAAEQASPYGAMARGGRVFGPGGPTGDAILARLSAGEWVINAAAVSHYGDNMMRMINSMRFPGFAGGGGVTVSGPKQIFNLTIGGETFAGLTAPKATASRLVAYAVSQQVRSAGRKPTWYGS